MADATRVKHIFNTATPSILLLIQVLCRRHIYLYSLTDILSEVSLKIKPIRAPRELRRDKLLIKFTKYDEFKPVHCTSFDCL